MADADVPIKYMDRTRHYYRALGYTQDYIWATFDDVPFSQPVKPLSEMRVVLITTASPLDFDGVKRVWSAHVSPPPPELFTDNVAWDKETTHTDDRASFLPIEAASELASEGLFRGVAARFHGVPSEYSQRKTLTEDAPEILSCVREDRAERRSSMSSLSCLPSDRQLGGSSPRNERDSYRNCRIGIRRYRALRCSQVLFHGLSAW
jgi:D-proline reductase (dithiol) PrdB